MQLLETTATTVSLIRTGWGFVKGLFKGPLRKENEALKEQLRELKGFQRLRSEMVYSNSEGVYWQRGSSEGPFCPYCLDADHRAIRLNPGATRGTFTCPFHQEVSFATKEYDPRPVVRSRRHSH